MGLEDRVRALEKETEELRELVDGQEAWSHRKRLHALEGNQGGVEFAARALKAYQETRDNRITQLREWGGFALAVAAIAITTFFR